METEKESTFKDERPSVLYHASRNPDIERFEPRSDKTRDAEEGPVIFATPDWRMALVFLVETDDSWTASGVCNDVPYLVIGDEKRFTQLDTGAFIYFLPSDTFGTDPGKGLREYEWTSKEAVVPTGKQYIPSALEAMIEHGVQIYFTDMETIRAIHASDDGGETIIKGLLSENEKRLSRS